MKIRPNSPGLLGAGIAVSVLILGLVGLGRVLPVHVPTIGTWEDEPVLCARDVPFQVVAQAVAWWRTQGHPITIGCDDWTISLDADPTVDTRASVDDVAVTHGATLTHVDEGVVVAAEIRVLPGSSSLVVAHELGHALGYLHPPLCPSGHLMHPHRPGWDGRGLRREP